MPKKGGALSRSVKSPVSRKEPPGFLHRSPSLPITISPIVLLSDESGGSIMDAGQVTPSPFSCSIPMTTTNNNGAS